MKRTRISSTTFTQGELSLIRKALLRTAKDSTTPPEKKSQVMDITLRLEGLMGQHKAIPERIKSLSSPVL